MVADHKGGEHQSGMIFTAPIFDNLPAMEEPTSGADSGT
jgi:hypothetical protein